ncbi:hypothetical protein DFH09DRAFT_1091858 [Mycena vulgaris]|nr:hypothetical protein DFH09DRAFT_1091858 [Mycena vulgaris]
MRVRDDEIVTRYVGPTDHIVSDVWFRHAELLKEEDVRRRINGEAFRNNKRRRDGSAPDAPATSNEGFARRRAALAAAAAESDACAAAEKKAKEVTAAAAAAAAADAAAAAADAAAADAAAAAAAAAAADAAASSSKGKGKEGEGMDSLVTLVNLLLSHLPCEFDYLASEPRVPEPRLLDSVTNPPVLIFFKIRCRSNGSLNLAKAMGWPQCAPFLIAFWPPRCEGSLHSAYALVHQHGCDNLDMTQSPDLDYKNLHLDIPQGICAHDARSHGNPPHTTPITPPATSSFGISHTFETTSILTNSISRDSTHILPPWHDATRSHGITLQLAHHEPSRRLGYHLQFGLYKIQAIPMGIPRDTPSDRPVSSHPAHKLTTTKLLPE